MVLQRTGCRYSWYRVGMCKEAHKSCSPIVREEVTARSQQEDTDGGHGPKASEGRNRNLGAYEHTSFPWTRGRLPAGRVYFFERAPPHLSCSSIATFLRTVRGFVCFCVTR